MVLVTPYVGNTKSLTLKGLAAGIVAFPILNLLSTVMNKKGIKKTYYPLAIVLMSLVGIGIAKLLSESAYELITSVFSFFMRTGGGLTIAEASPLLSSGGVFTLQPLWYNFGTLGYISFFALAILIYKAFTKKNTPENTFLIVWTLMIIWAMLQQNRFAYYYSVNAAILSAWIGISILDLAGWQNLTNSIKSKHLLLAILKPCTYFQPYS